MKYREVVVVAAVFVVLTTAVDSAIGWLSTILDLSVGVGMLAALHYLNKRSQENTK